MFEVSRDNFYKYVPNAVSVLLIDKKGTLSGEAMKQLNYRLPDVYGALKQRLQKLGDKVQVGSVIKIGHYYFIVARDKYQNRWSAEVFKQIWSAVSPKILNTYTVIFNTEDYEWIADAVQEYNYPHNVIKFCNHCQFGDDWSENEN